MNPRVFQLDVKVMKVDNYSAMIKEAISSVFSIIWHVFKHKQGSIGSRKVKREYFAAPSNNSQAEEPAGTVLQCFDTAEDRKERTKYVQHKIDRTEANTSINMNGEMTF